MLKLPFFLAAILWLPATALGDDNSTGPVDEVMAVTVANWSGEAAPETLFSDDRLHRLFSEDFRRLYAEAQENTDEDSVEPFGYDVVVNAQDGCPIEDLTISTTDTGKNQADVMARFRFLACLGDDDRDQVFSETRFKLVEEDGQIKIDDIISTNPSGDVSSAKDQLRLITSAPRD